MPTLRAIKRTTEWTCARCTLVNGAHRETCDACFGPAPEIAIPPELLEAPPTFEAAGAALTNHICQMFGVALKRTIDGRNVAVWSPGDLICRCVESSLTLMPTTAPFQAASNIHSLRG